MIDVLIDFAQELAPTQASKAATYRDSYKVHAWLGDPLQMINPQEENSATTQVTAGCHILTVS